MHDHEDQLVGALGLTMHGFVLPAVGKLSVPPLAVQPPYVHPIRVTLGQSQ